MPQDEQVTLTLIGDPIAQARQDSVDVIECIRSFDAGCDAMYLTDAEGRYTGRAITKTGFHAIFDSKDNIVQSIPSIASKFLTGKVANDILRQIEQLFDSHPDWNELPVTRNGRITMRLAKHKPTLPELWKTPTPFIPIEYFDYEAIYISSMENEGLRSFFNLWKPQLPIYPLSSTNIRKSLSDGKNLLVYAEDVFPTCKKKSVTEVFEDFVEWELKRIEGMIFIRRDYASVKKSDHRDIVKLIEYFDEGYDAVVVEDDEGRLDTVIASSTFSGDFPRRYVRAWGNLFIEEDEDETALRRTAARWFYGTARKELPIVDKEKHVVASAVLGDSGIHGGLKELRKMQPLRWEYISDEVALDFFGKHRQVLVSSTKGSLAGFIERFSDVLDITVYSDDVLDKVMSSEFDMVICRGDIWNVNAIRKYDVEVIYGDLMTETIRRCLEAKGVSYHVFMRGNVKNQSFMIQREKTTPTFPAMMLINEKFSYYAFTDNQNKMILNIIGGIRKTTDLPSSFRNSIYFFGHCPAIGYFMSDGETLESCLQRHINSRSLPYRIVNCSNGPVALGNVDITHIHRLIDTPFKEGDIIIQFVNCLYDDSLVRSKTFSNYHRYDEVFNLHQNQWIKCFHDSNPVHQNTIGNKILADYIYSIIEPELIAAQNHEVLEPFMLFDSPSDKEQKLSVTPELSKYLDCLAEYRPASGDVGAIVMNCNPFTRGHAYLVERARETVDTLFVFVVEEDLSEFPFVDRFAIAKENCKKYPNVKVLPSGKYMISRATFDEYFNKESLQDKEINPANDVNLFARYISPCLGITRRFVGEEPFDTVTRQYNETMKEILPRSGIELVEISRLTVTGGEPVNATTVRHLLFEGRLDSCRALLTDETYLYLKKQWRRLRDVLRSRRK